ncbi:complement C1q tumor necrosis factor-related protein 3 [Esox lucius]|uniref:C1q domain-containing protein n=1 Tax=Esox lucius TaxID=8010 RepID=A0A3P8Y2M3_ESOLU|nr:complement C1q tumor necrosis factor-related protein 3 [Esox lucius]
MKIMMKVISLQLIVLVCLSFGQADDSIKQHQADDPNGNLGSSSLSDVSQLSAMSSAVNVAFSAALRPPSQDSEGYGHIGPFTAATNLVHKHVITNIGNAYSSSTGSFTAPVNGVYFFTFTSYSWAKTVNIGVALYKNHEEVALVYEHQDKGDNEDFASSGITLKLVKGDKVYLVLPSGFMVTANAYRNVSTFSGFLIFQM